jgi:hypothetical protein
LTVAGTYLQKLVMFETKSPDTRLRLYFEGHAC